MGIQGNCTSTASRLFSTSSRILGSFLYSNQLYIEQSLLDFGQTSFSVTINNLPGSGTPVDSQYVQLVQSSLLSGY
jgi:hypothetical protein